MSDYKSLQRMVGKAKIGIIQKKDSIFLSTILFSLKQKWDTSIPTACVDGITITINPDWFKTLDKEEVMGLLAHESWHVALNHMHRVGSRDPKKFNTAADYVINLILKDAGFKLPEGGLYSTKYRDMSTEQVYATLPPEPPQISSGGMGPDDIKPPGKEKTESEQRAMQDAVKDILVKAATASKLANESAGTIPGDIQRMMDELLNPKLDWRILLQNYMTAFAKEDYTYKRPNRRFFPDLYLPSLYSESMGEIAIAVDTSGSVSKQEFIGFLSEINSIKEHLKPSLTTIIDFDTRINNVTKLSPDEGIEHVKFAGGGGTDLRPVFDYYNKVPPVVLIVFSDLYCARIEEDPGYPVLWICCDNPSGAVNFGELIHFESKE